MKLRKVIAMSMVFIGLSALNVFFSAMIHRFFSHAADWMRFGTFVENLNIILSNENVRKIYLSIEILIALGLVLASLTRIQTYKSDLVKITEDISIPKSVGQYQYGSARFYNKDEINKVFGVVNISKSDNLIRELIERGYDDLQEEN